MCVFLDYVCMSTCGCIVGTVAAAACAQMYACWLEAKKQPLAKYSSYVSLIATWLGADGCIWYSISILMCKVNTLFLSHPICEQGLTLKMSGQIFHCMSNSVSTSVLKHAPPKKNYGDKSMLRLVVTDLYRSQIRCYTFYHSIQNINLGQNVAASFYCQ